MTQQFAFIGLTGGIGSGKSALTKILQDYGLAVIQADACVHQILGQDLEVQNQIRNKFGNQVFDAKGQILRKELGKFIFASEANRLWLEGLLHPKVRLKVEDFKKETQAQGGRVVFYEVPLLFEKNLKSQFDEVWLVTAPEMLRIQRVMARDQLSFDEVKLRMQAQLPQEQKVQQSDLVFDNSKDLEALKHQVHKACLDKGFLSPETSS